MPPSDFVVTPVLAWWERPTPVGPRDPAEVASVHRVSIAELVDPTNRFRVRHPSGFVGPAFGVRDLIVWGFTGGLLDRLIYLGGGNVHGTVPELSRCQIWPRSLISERR